MVPRLQRSTGDAMQESVGSLGGRSEGHARPPGWLLLRSGHRKGPSCAIAVSVCSMQPTDFA
eukprot:4175527-Amphidinium_carterae.2